MVTLLSAIAPPIRLGTPPSISRGHLFLPSCPSLWLQTSLTPRSLSVAFLGVPGLFPVNHGGIP